MFNWCYIEFKLKDYFVYKQLWIIWWIWSDIMQIIFMKRLLGILLDKVHYLKHTFSIFMTESETLQQQNSTKAAVIIMVMDTFS